MGPFGPWRALLVGPVSTAAIHRQVVHNQQHHPTITYSYDLTNTRISKYSYDFTGAVPYSFDPVICLF